MSFRGGLAGRVRKGGDAGGVETCAFKSSQSPVRALDNWPIGARGLAAGGEEPARVHPVAYAEAELPDLAAYIRFIISKRRLVCQIRRDVCGIRTPALRAEARAR
jgi:hypothetical protein